LNTVAVRKLLQAAVDEMNARQIPLRGKLRTEPWRYTVWES
jgi:hypothetical protein